LIMVCLEAFTRNVSQEPILYESCAEVLLSVLRSKNLIPII
jgi:hypothetical protein